jgi:hypothetical protein
VTYLKVSLPFHINTKLSKPFFFIEKGDQDEQGPEKEVAKEEAKEEA